MQLYDPSNRIILEGDLLVNEQGKLFFVMETDESIMAERHVKVKTAKDHTYLSIDFCFVLTPEAKDLDQNQLKILWQRLYELHCREKNRQSIADRRGDFQENKRRKDATPRSEK